MSVTPEQLALNLKSAENLARINAGLPPTSQLPDDSLTYAQRISFNKEMAKIISQYPDRFTAALATTAADVTAKTYQPLETNSLTESVAVFTSEAGRQLVGLNDSLNPFAEDNRAKTASTLKWLLIALALGGALIYFGPTLFEAGNAMKKRRAIPV